MLDLYYDDHLDCDTFVEEQKRIETEQRQARLRLAEAQSGLDGVEATIERAIDLLRSWPDQMDTAIPELQDSFHQVFYDFFKVAVDDDETPAVTFEQLEHTRHLRAVLSEAQEVLDQNENKPALALASAGSNMSNLVPRTGFEPVLPP